VRAQKNWNSSEGRDRIDLPSQSNNELPEVEYIQSEITEASTASYTNKEASTAAL
jgi:hypothetical protein